VISKKQDKNYLVKVQATGYFLAKFLEQIQLLEAEKIARKM
jgi:hypothetical protein